METQEVLCYLIASLEVCEQKACVQDGECSPLGMALAAYRRKF